MKSGYTQLTRVPLKVWSLRIENKKCYEWSGEKKTRYFPFHPNPHWFSVWAFCRRIFRGKGIGTRNCWKSIHWPDSNVDPAIHGGIINAWHRVFELWEGRKACSHRGHCFGRVLVSGFFNCFFDAPGVSLYQGRLFFQCQSGWNRRGGLYRPLHSRQPIQLSGTYGGARSSCIQRRLWCRAHRRWK